MIAASLFRYYAVAYAVAGVLKTRRSENRKSKKVTGVKSRRSVSFKDSSLPTVLSRNTPAIRQKAIFETIGLTLIRMSPECRTTTNSISERISMETISKRRMSVVFVSLPPQTISDGTTPANTKR